MHIPFTQVPDTEITEYDRKIKTYTIAFILAASLLACSWFYWLEEFLYIANESNDSSKHFDVSINSAFNLVEAS